MTILWILSFDPRQLSILLDRKDTLCLSLRRFGQNFCIPMQSFSRRMHGKAIRRHVVQRRPLACVECPCGVQTGKTSDGLRSCTSGVTSWRRTASSSCTTSRPCGALRTSLNTTSRYVLLWGRAVHAGKAGFLAEFASCVACRVAVLQRLRRHNQGDAEQGARDQQAKLRHDHGAGHAGAVHGRPPTAQTCL